MSGKRRHTRAERRPQPTPRSALDTRGVLLRTAGLYILIVLVLLLTMRNAAVAKHILAPFTTAVASTATAVLTLLGVPAIHIGPRIFTANQAAVDIDNECTGLEAVILLLPAIVVFPARTRAKAIGVVLGLGVMAVINFARVVSLCYLGTYSATALQVGHLYVWPAVVIVVALLTFLVWVERFARPLDP